jgi:hypothetical protein
MTKTSRILIIATALVAAAHVEAGAQSSSAPASLGFVNINGGAQPATRSIEKSETRPLFGETATISASQGIKNGAIFDMSAGYRVWHGLAVAFGYTHLGSNSDSSVVAVIPDPLIFDRPKTVTATQTGLGHSEDGFHLQAVWFLPIDDKIDVAVSIGPSFIKVKQELVSGFTIPAGTQNLALTVGSEEGTATGINVGVDGSYLFTRNFGVGLFLRYAGGSVDLPSVPDLHVGGFQIGLGARVRF